MVLLRALRFLTVEQWRKIDEDYQRENANDGRVAAILITVAISLILARYFGRSDYLTSFPAMKKLFASWTYPDLYPRLWWAGFKLINYFLVPALCIKLFLKERIRDFGWTGHFSTKTWLLYLAMLAVVVPMAYGVSYTEAFLKTYPKYDGASGSWTQFFVWEAAYGFQFLMLEAFFRGFILFSLARYIGSSAIFVAIVPYAMIHFGKPMAETIGSVLAGIALGTIALRTRSIYGGVLVHCGVAWSMDVFAMMRKGELAALWAGQ